MQYAQIHMAATNASAGKDLMVMDICVKVRFEFWIHTDTNKVITMIYHFIEILLVKLLQ
jgi:hypothetical protein